MITNINEFKSINESKKSDFTRILTKLGLEYDSDDIWKADGAYHTEIGKYNVILDNGVLIFDDDVTEPITYDLPLTQEEFDHIQQLFNKNANVSMFNEALNVTFEDIVDMKEFQKFAEALLLMCNGEYGNTYYNPTELKIGIVLGDSNPFDDHSLEDWMKNTFIKNYKHLDKLYIEIDSEWIPGHDGWLKWNGKKWINS